MTLSARLSAFLLGAVGLLLLAFSATLYGLAAKYLNRQVDERLDAALNTLVAAAEVNAGGVEWEPEERSLSFGRRTVAEPFLWVVRDDRGRLVDGSIPESDPRFPIFLAPANGPRAATVADRDGHPWRLLSRRLDAPPEARLASDPGGATRYAALRIGAAASLSGTREAVANLGWLLAGLSAGTWLLTAIVGGRLSRRALRPVAAMAEAARAIGGDDVAPRLPQPRSGDELADLGRAFNDLLDRLDEAHERQRRFTGDASHQLRTPLTAIQGQVDLALRQDRSPEEYRRVLTLVRSRARHLGQIVEALLFLARADAEAHRPAFEAIDLCEWLPDHLGARPGSGELRLDVEPGSPCIVRAQRTLLGELLDNLLDNAEKYGAADAPTLVTLRGDEGGVRIAVADAGPGVAPEAVPFLFEPFYRADAARTRGAPGLGLGLSVAAKLARLFGGELGVQSTPGLGSTFTIRLPRAESLPPL